MPTWRKLHVKATESLDINDMPDDFHRLLWVMLPLGLDREGRGLDNPAWVKAKAMPLRVDVTLDMIQRAMAWYAERGMIERYQVEGRSYFWIPSFHRYQGNTSREAASEYPAPPADCDINSRPTHDQLMSNSSTDADADADAEEMQMQMQTGDAAPATDNSSSPDGARIFELVERAGILVNQSMAEEYLAILEEAGDIHLVELAFQEAAKSGSRPVPKWLRTVIQRCKRESRLPGEWGQGARASPNGNGKSTSFQQMTDEERLKLALERNARYMEGEADG